MSRSFTLPFPLNPLGRPPDVFPDPLSVSLPPVPPSFPRPNHGPNIAVKAKIASVHIFGELARFACRATARQK